jgi:POT family proton-dependent oligopeptide transporter
VVLGQGEPPVGEVRWRPPAEDLVGADAGGTIVTRGALEGLAARPLPVPVKVSAKLVGTCRPEGAERAAVEEGDVGKVVPLLPDDALVGEESEGAALTAEKIAELKSRIQPLEVRVVRQEDVGRTIKVRPTEALLEKQVGGQAVTEERLADWTARIQPVKVEVGPEHVGMGLGGTEVKASVFQAANPLFILLFGLVFSALWTWLQARKLEPNTPVKFALGLAQLSLGFGVLWYGAQHGSAVGMVGMTWLLLAYLLHTTGELCLSPVGLSMVTRLSPMRVVSMVMGGWFLATAFSQQLSSVVAKLTSVGGEGECGGLASIPPPIDTVHVYGDVFWQVTLISMGSAVVLFLASPLLKRMMHEDKLEGGGGARSGH